MRIMISEVREIWWVCGLRDVGDKGVGEDRVCLGGLVDVGDKVRVGDNGGLGSLGVLGDVGDKGIMECWEIRVMGAIIKGGVK